METQLEMKQSVDRFYEWRLEYERIDGEWVYVSTFFALAHALSSLDDHKARMPETKWRVIRRDKKTTTEVTEHVIA